MENNISAVGEWNNIEDFFNYLNHNICYVVLRNYECLPDKYTMKDHEDIDLLVDSLDEFKKFVGGKRKRNFKFIGYTTIVKIKNEEVKLDIRYIGDGYYDSLWERDILNSRVLEKNLFYRTDDDNYKYSLSYHAIFHKYKFSDKYSSRLGKILLGADEKIDEKRLLSLVKDYMEQKKYRITEPRDIYVEFGAKYVCKTRLIRRKCLKLARRVIAHIWRLIWVKK